MEDPVFNVVFQTARFAQQPIPVQAVLKGIHCIVEHAKYVLTLIVNYVQLITHVQVVSACTQFIVDLVFLAV